MKRQTSEGVMAGQAQYEELVRQFSAFGAVKREMERPHGGSHPQWPAAPAVGVLLHKPQPTPALTVGRYERHTDQGRHRIHYQGRVQIP